MPEVSVIMPAYNAEATIRDAIQSVLNQTFTDYELIIINDCSIDSTQSIIDNMAYNDARIIPLRNDTNSGVSYSRNYGVSCANGNWIAFLDSDDMWRANKLEKQLAVLKSHPDVVISYTASAFIDSNGNFSTYILKAYKKTTYKTLLKKNLVSCSSAMVKASIMKQIKMPGDMMHEDYYAWLTILKTAKYAYGVDEPLLVYRISENSKSSNRIKSAMMIFNTYQAVGYNRFLSLLLTFRYSVHSITKRYKINKYLGDNKE